ncbi:MAG: hypothetical protein QOD99_615 [Chthoniobacter sp.]|nr:hypothetical protein [Chthoniobacter sp.]
MPLRAFPEDCWPARLLMRKTSHFWPESLDSSGSKLLRKIKVVVLSWVMQTKPVTTIAAALFGVAAIIHLLRLILRFPVVIAGFLVPLWVNAIGLGVAGWLAWKLSEEASE